MKNIYSSVQKFGVSDLFFCFFLKENNTFIQQGCVKLIKKMIVKIVIVRKKIF